MLVKFFNRYDIRIPITCINPLTNDTYTCTAMPRSKGELLEGYIIGETTKASYPKLQIEVQDEIVVDAIENTEEE